MCSILGFGFQFGNKLKNDRRIQEALTKLFINSQSRGRTSTGAAFINRKDAVVIKHKMSADRFVQTEEFKQSLSKYVSVERVKEAAPYPPLSVLGHCRYPTKGTPDKNHNNHPIISGNMVGVHNGSIRNDEELWEKFKLYDRRKGMVDSEIIFALINYFAEQEKSHLGYTADAITEASSYLEGGYACAMVNVANPYCVWLFRNHNPCVVWHFYSVGLVVWGSAEIFLENALEHAKFGPYERFTIPANYGMGIDLHRGKFESFELNQPKARRSFWGN